MDPKNTNGLLTSIFDNISLNGKELALTKPHYYGRHPLALHEDVLFPKEKQGAVETKELLDKLRVALPKEYEETESYLEGVLSALQRFASNVSSTFQADVSFYDQQRMTAALALCLLDKEEQIIQTILSALKDRTKASSPTWDEPVAMLVGGDISGIQDFIYTVTAKGAARTLRGRSFYLQLLTEAVLRFVLDKLEIPYTNVIFSGGGHFFLLAPSSKADRLPEIQKAISRSIYKHHHTDLYFALGSTNVPLKGFVEGNFPSYWGMMHSSMAQKKGQRYSELGDEVYERIFSVPEFGGNPDNKCDVCGDDHRKTRTWDDRETQDKICHLCFSFFEDLGKKLPKTRFVALGLGATNALKATTAFNILAEFGLTVQLLENAREAIEIVGRDVVLWALDDPEDDDWPKADGAAKWLRYTANRVTPLSFDELQKKVRGGFERLGVLRMDVDNLGDLFKSGFGEQATLTRLATLSYRTSLFFEGWLKQLCEKEERKDLIYTVYAGGDDVFLVGPWDLIPDLAQEITKDFATYTGDNPDIHLSAGMAFIDGKYPVYQAAEDAKNAIDQAKALPGKNAFSFLGRPWSWSEFASISDKQDKLKNLVVPKGENQKRGPQAILQLIQRLALDEMQHNKVKGKHIWGRWIWMGMYQLTRLQEQHKELAGDIKAISDELHGNQYLEINQWGVAARWAELEERKKSIRRMRNDGCNDHDCRPGRQGVSYLCRTNG